MPFELLIEILTFQEVKDLLPIEDRILVKNELQSEIDRSLKQLDHRFLAKIGLFNDDQWVLVI